jgi:hypothetical protein
MKPLPQRDVEARATRQGAPRLTLADQRALASLEDESLRRVLAELLLATHKNQENFETIEQWFPVQPADVAESLRGGGGGGSEGGTSAIGVIEHGEEGATERPETFGHYIWIGSATPVNAEEGDFWVKSVASSSEDLLTALNGMLVLDVLGNRAENPLGEPWEKPTWAENIGKTISEANGHGWLSREDFKVAAALYPTKLAMPLRGSIAVQAQMLMGNQTVGSTVQGLWLLFDKVHKTGYRLKHVSGGTGKASVVLERWDSGTVTTLDESAVESELQTANFVLTIDAAGVGVWRENAARTALVQVLSAPDTTYANGYAAIESNRAFKECGTIGSNTEPGGFRAQELPISANTVVTLYFRLGTSWYSV